MGAILLEFSIGRDFGALKGVRSACPACTKSYTFPTLDTVKSTV